MTKAVVFITGQDPLEGRGGGSTYVRVHARAAQQAGFEPHIFCLGSQSNVAQADFGIVHRIASPVRPYGRWRVAPGAQAERVFAHWLNSVIFTPYLVAAQAPFLAAGVERFLRTRPGPHLLHGFYTWGCVGLSVARRLRRQGVETAVVSSVYTTAEHEVQAKVRGGAACRNRALRWLTLVELHWIKRMVSRYEQQVYTASRLVLVNYDSVRRLFQARYGAGAEVRKLPYASETAFRPQTEAAIAAPPLPPMPDTPLLVAVARHDPRKGLDVLLRALAALRAKGIRFRACLIGGGPLLGAHRQLVRQLGLDEVVTLTGPVPDPQPYLQQADIFVLPSLEEGSGSLALLEALQAGCAIVASNVDGIPEDVTDGDSALLVEPGNVAALSRALGRVLSDAPLRTQLRRRARETFETRFSALACTRALQEVYAELGFEGGDG